MRPQPLTLLFIAIIRADADALAGQRAQEGVRHSQEHTKQGHPVHLDAAQQADDCGNGQHHEAHTLSAEQRQQQLLRLCGIASRLCRLRAERADRASQKVLEAT